MSDRLDCLLLGESRLAQICAIELARAGLSVAIALVSSSKVAGVTDFATPALPDHYWTLAQSIGQHETKLWWEMSRLGCQHLRGLCQPLAGTLVGSGLLLASNPTESYEMLHSLRPMGQDGFEVRMMSGGAASNFAPVKNPESAILLGGVTVFHPSQLDRLLEQTLDELKIQRLEAAEDCELLCCENEVMLANESSCYHAEMAVVFGDTLQPNLRLPGLQTSESIETVGQVNQGFHNSVALASSNRGHEFYWNQSISPFRGSQPLHFRVTNPAELPREQLESYALSVGSQRVTELCAWEARERQPSPIATLPGLNWQVSYNFHSPDGLPILGPRAGSSRVWQAGGFGGFRNSLGVGAALELAKAILGQPNRLSELTTGSPRRFLRR